MRCAVPLSLLILTALAACGGSHAAHPTSSAEHTATWSTVATATPSRTGPLTTGPNVRPGETPPAPPPMTHDSAGALAFAAYYVQALDWSAATNDTYLLEQISLPTCRTCQRNIDGAQLLRKAGATEHGGRVTLVSARVVTGTFDVTADRVVELTTDDEAVVIAHPNAESSTAAPALNNNKSLAFLRWVGRGWMIVEIEAAP